MLAIAGGIVLGTGVFNQAKATKPVVIYCAGTSGTCWSSNTNTHKGTYKGDSGNVPTTITLGDGGR